MEYSISDYDDDYSSFKIERLNEMPIDGTHYGTIYMYDIDKMLFFNVKITSYLFFDIIHAHIDGKWVKLNKSNIKIEKLLSRQKLIDDIEKTRNHYKSLHDGSIRRGDNEWIKWRDLNRKCNSLYNYK